MPSLRRIVHLTGSRPLGMPATSQSPDDDFGEIGTLSCSWDDFLAWGGLARGGEHLFADELSGIRRMIRYAHHDGDTNTWNMLMLTPVFVFTCVCVFVCLSTTRVTLPYMTHEM